MRIRSELILFFLVISVLPLSAVVYISYEHSRAAIRDSLMANLLGATENTGLAIDNWMNARKDDINVISQSETPLAMDKGHFRAFLNAIESEYQGIYKEFFMLDQNGNIVFSTLNRTGNAGNEQYFTQARGGKMYISDVYLAESSNSPEIVISNPVRNNGTVAGIMAARVSMENLFGIIDKIDIGRSGEAFIVDKDGNIIFHENRSKILHDDIKNNLAVREVIYEKSGISEYVNYKGEEVLGSYYWLPLYRWGLVVEENRDEAYAQVRGLGWLTAGVSIFAVFCVVLLAIVVSGRQTKPISSLKDGALDLVRGHFKPIPVTSKNEIGELTEIFNRTAAELLEIRKKLEMKIELANRDLEEKNRELVAANDELKKLDGLKSDFISMVSHELKTPLSAIRTSAEFLELEKTATPDIQKEMFENIIWNIDRLTQMINDILDISKIEAGKMEYHTDPVDLHEISKLALENTGHLVLKKNITISTDFAEKLSPVYGDKEKLIIVLNNLLGNAVKFTPYGGDIFLSVKEDKDGIEVNVRDTGIGIEKEKIEKIFDKFYQVDGTSRRKAGGSGLGLTISKEIIRAHGSDICVESEPGKGSNFHFRLKKSGQ